MGEFQGEDAMARGAAAAAASAKRKNKRARASGRGPAPKRARSSGPVVWSGSEASTSGGTGASGSGSSKSTATREPPALKALGRVDEERERERREEFLRSLEGLSDEDRDVVVKSALVTLKEMFTPMAAEDEVRRKLFDAAVTVARDKSESDADKIRASAPFASALAVPTETSITMILQWPRKFASHVKEMTVDEFSKDGCAEVKVQTAKWLAQMDVREGGEGGEERRCATGRVMEKLVAELAMTDEDGEESASTDVTEKHHPVAWVDASEFAPAPDEEEYEKPQKDCDSKNLSPPAVFKDAARATAEVFSQAIATGELKSKLVVVCGSVAVSTLLGALKRNTRVRLHKAGDASYAAYGLESEAVQLTSFSGMYVVRCDDGRVVFLIAFPALQQLWAGSQKGWKTFATGAATMITLMKTLAGRASWDAERVAEKGKGIVRALGSLGGRMTVQLGVGIHAGTAEERSENAAKGGRTSKERGVGIFGLSAEKRSENAAKAGRRAAQIKREAERLKVKQEFGTVISRGKQTTRYCELEFVLGPHKEKFMMTGTISSKGVWKATTDTNMYSVGPLLRRLKEFALQTGGLSAGYACEHLESLVFNTGWYESPPFSDEIRRNKRSFGNLLRELVQKGVCEVRRKSPSAL